MTLKRKGYTVTTSEAKYAKEDLKKNDVEFHTHSEWLKHLNKARRTSFKLIISDFFLQSDSCMATGFFFAPPNSFTPNLPIIYTDFHEHINKSIANIWCLLMTFVLFGGGEIHKKGERVSRR